MAAKTIKIRFTRINDAIVVKNVRAGSTLKDLATDLEVQASSLRVGGERKPAGYVIRANDFIVCVDTTVAGA